MFIADLLFFYIYVAARLSVFVCLSVCLYVSLFHVVLCVENIYL